MESGCAHLGVKELISFVDGLPDDAVAIANACTKAWSNGMVEGFNHELKWIKRRTSGQAGFPLREPPREARIQRPGNPLTKSRGEALPRGLPLPHMTVQVAPDLSQRLLQQHKLCDERRSLVAPLVLLRYTGNGKERAMPKRSSSQHVPKDMQARFEEITHLTDDFCRTYLNDEYAQLSRELTATLSCKRPSPLGQGRATVWACGIIHAASHGQLSFRFLADPSHCRKRDLGVLRAQFFHYAGQI